MGLTEPRGFRDVQRWVWLFHIFSLPQTSVLQQKHQLQALSAHMSSIDLEQMHKNIIFPVVIHNTACIQDSPALYQGRLHTADKEKVLHLKSCWSNEATFVVWDRIKCQPGHHIV